MSAIFNLYDYIFFAFILFFTFLGLVRGFWIQLFSTGIWLAAISFYYVYGVNFERDFLSQYMSTTIAHWFGLALILVGCFFINFIVRFILGSIFKINAFTFFNKLGGLIFGACASAIIALLIIYAVNYSNISKESTDWQQSYVVSKVTPFLASFKEHNDNNTSFSTTTASNTTVPKVADTTAVA